MAAVPFTESAIFRGTSNGRVIHYPLTLSDVANAYAISPDGGDYIQLPSDQNYALVDLIVVVGGTDTSQQQFFINGLSTPLLVNSKASLNTSNFRQFATAPVTFAAGSKVKIKQIA